MTLADTFQPGGKFKPWSTEFKDVMSFPQNLKNHLLQGCHFLCSAKKIRRKENNL